MGNITAGHELISRTAKQDVFGMSIIPTYKNVAKQSFLATADMLISASTIGDLASLWNLDAEHSKSHTYNATIESLFLSSTQ